MKLCALWKNNNVPVFVFVFSIFLFGVFTYYNKYVKSITEFPFQWPNSHEMEEKHVSMTLPIAEDEEDVQLPPRECNLFMGDWEFDNATHLSYKEDECEFLTEQVTCVRNRRMDFMYQSWRWQSKDCSLPSYATSKYKPRLLVKRLRNKRMMFVGDSLNRNQWESMICLAQSVTPEEGRASRNRVLLYFQK